MAKKDNYLNNSIRNTKKIYSVISVSVGPSELALSASTSFSCINGT